MNRGRALRAGIGLAVFLIGWWCSGFGLERGIALTVFYVSAMIFAVMGWWFPAEEKKAETKAQEPYGLGAAYVDLSQMQREVAKIDQIQRDVAALALIVGFRSNRRQPARDGETTSAGLGAPEPAKKP